MNIRRRLSTRKPVRRARASHYILLSLLSFAVSVSLTRLFLNLTGFPQIGSGVLHIAHLLWGGLLLFIATLMPLLFANRWALTLTAIFSGTGVGLFIDEVGKFITRSNDYFFPAAAPIIYALFLITVLIYNRTRRRQIEDPRSEMYHIIDELEEVLDRDLSDEERATIIARLHRVNTSSSDKNLTRLSKSLEVFIESKKTYVVPHVPDLWEQIQASFTILAQKFVTQGRLRVFLISGLAVLGAWTIADPVSFLIRIKFPNSPQALVLEVFRSFNIRGNISLESFVIRLGLEAAVGVILLAAAVLLTIRKDHRAFSYGYLGLVLLLTVVNLLVFYFDQFSTIGNATVELVFMLALFYYRDHFLDRRI